MPRKFYRVAARLEAGLAGFFVNQGPSVSLKAALIGGVAALALVCPAREAAAQGSGRDPTVALGKALFSDTELSNPVGQSCASCHAANAGFTFPDSTVNQQFGVAPGALTGRFGFRAVPQISYSKFNPPGPVFDPTIELYIGGQFWDGHAKHLQEQATFPFVNPNEMNNLTHNLPDPALVVQRLAQGNLAEPFKRVFGTGVFSQVPAKVFEDITIAIAAYEKSEEVSPFSSKYDAWRAGLVELTPQELLGLRLTTGSWTGRMDGATFPVFAHCVECHMIPTIPSGGPDLWTNTCYQNIGVPRNGDNPFYTQTDPTTNPAGYNPQGRAFIDYGLGAVLYPREGLPPGNVGPGSDPRGDYLGINGQFKAPSLRNVDLRPNAGFVKAYMHNGSIKSLEDVVHFYNTRNLTTHPGEVIDFTRPDPYEGLQGMPLWGRPEYASPETLVNAEGALGTLPGTGPGGESSAQVGNLGLTQEQEAAIVAFLRTLSDGYFDPHTIGGCVPISSQPVSQTVCVHGQAQFTVASGTQAPVTYQWRHNGAPMKGHTHSFYTIVSAGLRDAGTYDCVITAACGSATSRTVSLFVCAADFNCDGKVDPSDMEAFLEAFQAGDPSADLNDDGVVDARDLAVFVQAMHVRC